MNRITRGLFLWALVFGLMAAQAQAAVSGSYVGRVQGSEAFIAVVASEGKLIAYLCDGKERVQWFRGAVGEGGALDIRTQAGWRLQGKLGAGGPSGTVTFADGKTLRFSATPATGEAGLYRSERTVDGTLYLGGWIVDQKGEQRGAVIGGGTLSAAVLVPSSRKAQHLRLGELLAFLINPNWVRQNVTF